MKLVNRVSSCAKAWSMPTGAFGPAVNSLRNRLELPNQASERVDVTSSFVHGLIRLFVVSRETEPAIDSGSYGLV